MHTISLAWWLYSSRTVQTRLPGLWSQLVLQWRGNGGPPQHHQPKRLSSGPVGSGTVKSVINFVHSTQFTPNSIQSSKLVYISHDYTQIQVIRTTRPTYSAHFRDQIDFINLTKQEFNTKQDILIQRSLASVQLKSSGPKHSVFHWIPAMSSL